MFKQPFVRWNKRMSMPFFTELPVFIFTSNDSTRLSGFEGLCDDDDGT